MCIHIISIAFGLSVGLIASVGIARTLPTGILNPWLLFLTTDILGIVAKKKWLALILGGAWGALTITSLGFINTLLTSLPVDLIGAMVAISDPIVSAFALFPLIAIFTQFGAKKGAIATTITLIIRLLVANYTTIYPDSIQVFIGVLLLLTFAIMNDKKNPVKISDKEVNLFSERTARIKKNVIWLMIGGALIAVACNVGVFAGSDVSIYMLADAHKATDPEVARALTQQASVAEFMRGLGFIPLIATTAITTGVYGIAGLTFIYPIGYLMPNPILAAIGGAIVIFLEVSLLGGIGKILGKFPSIRASSDNIRSAMFTVMEFALLIGSINATVKMGGYTGFFIGVMINFINELTGRRITKMAIGPVAAIATGVILNILRVVGLF
ncbi:MAG: YhfT family protein [Lachnospiraceae bacterium]